MPLPDESAPCRPSPPAASPDWTGAGRRTPRLSLALLLLLVPARGISAQPEESRSIRLPGGGSLSLRWLAPAPASPQEFQNIILVLPGGDSFSAPEDIEAFAAAGWTVVAPDPGCHPELQANLPLLLKHIRTTASPAGGRFVLAGPHGLDVSVLALAAANPFEFSDVYFTTAADAGADWDHPGGLRFTRVHLALRGSADPAPPPELLIRRLEKQASSVSRIPAGRDPEDAPPLDARTLLVNGY